MTVIVLDQYVEDQILTERRRSGADRFDEVWDGVYIMAPLADNDHHRLAARLTAVFLAIVNQDSDDQVYPGVNVSDREEARSGKLKLVRESRSTLDSKVLPIAWKLTQSKPRPKITITHQDGRNWRV